MSVEESGRPAPTSQEAALEHAALLKTLDDGGATALGLITEVVEFPTAPEPRPVTFTIAVPDDEAYRRICYTTAHTLVPGSEYTVPVPTTGGARYNGLLEGCQGGCDHAPWYLGLDPGFSALAGLRVLNAHTCSPALAHGPSQDRIQEALVEHCGSRSAQSLYELTADTTARTEDPGYRTLVTVLSNWGAWVSCSMYTGLSEWAAGKGPAHAAAATAGTSRIRFVEADLHHTARPHPPGLLDKAPGWDDQGTHAWVEASEKYGLRGVYQRQNIGLYALMYEIGMYGRSRLAWSAMALDCMFFADYNLFSDQSPCLPWWEYVERYSRAAVAAPDTYIGAYAAGCALTYGAIQTKQRREQEARLTTAMRRGGVVWEDKSLWTSFLVVDGGVAQMALVAGGCADDLANCAVARVINDVIDLGYDWASGDVCNSILTLSEGRTGRDDLAAAYRKVASVLNRMGTERNNSVGAAGLVTTHAWQMCNTRHRIIACALVSDDPGIGPTTTSATWHQAAVLGEPGDPGDDVRHDLVTGTLNGDTVELTARSWAAIAKHPVTGTLLYHGHCRLVEQRRRGYVPSDAEIRASEDILRNACLRAAMELDRDDFIEALWCWTLESFCATDMMWHAMIGSTAITSARPIGSDRWDDDNTMPEWTR